MSSQPFVVEEQSVPLERDYENDPRVTWRTLTSSDRTPTRELTSGVCEIEPGGVLGLHRHPPLELYYFLAGSGVVTLGAEDHPVSAGVTISIPGNTPHSIRNTGSTPLRLFYVFPVDSYSDVRYTMLDAAGH